MASETEAAPDAPVMPELIAGEEALRRVRQRGQWWGGLTLGGAGLLFASFFLPAINACGSPVIPASIALEAIQKHDRDAGLYFCMAGPAYIFGLLVGLAALLRLFGVTRFLRGLAVATTLLLVGLSLTLYGYWGVELCKAFSQGDLQRLLPHSIDDVGSYLVVVLMPLLAMWRVYRTRRLSNAWLPRDFLGAFWCVVWFGLYLIETPRVDVHYGLWCSFLGSALVTMGLVGEAAALTGVSWLQAAGRLLWGRVGRFMEDVGRCPQCQYALIGQTTPRCPECGRPFEWGEVGLAGPVGLEGTPVQIRSSPAGLAVRESSA